MQSVGGGIVVPNGGPLRFYVGGRAGVDQLVGNATAGPSSQIRSVEPMAEVSPVDDNDFLVGHCEGLVLRSLAAGKPFLCVVFFHGVHIP